MKFLSRIFKRKPVTIQTYRVKKTDAEKKRYEMTARLAKELGRANPLDR